MTQLDAVKKSLQEARSGLERLLESETTLKEIVKVGQVIGECLQKGGRVFSCGNGGSMCDAMHFAEELSGRYRDDRPGYAAVAISDVTHMSCVANDYGYEFVFSRYVEAHGRPGDVLLGITTSGSSKNVIKACESARAKGMAVVALTGKQDAAISSLAHHHIATPAGSYADRVQELHIKIIHILIELIERQLAPKNYKN